MICKKCAKHKHYKCKNGAWKTGSHCTCQHRIKVPDGYSLFLLNRYGTDDDVKNFFEDKRV